VLIHIILHKFYLCVPLSISDYMVSNGRINTENDLEIMSKEGIKRTRLQSLPGGIRKKWQSLERLVCVSAEIRIGQRSNKNHKLKMPF